MKAPASCRLMKPEERFDACDLVVRVFMRDVAPHYDREGVEHFLTYAASADALLERLGRNHFVAVAEEEGRIVGVIEMRDHRHISLFFVEHDRQMKGIGRSLLRAALGECLRLYPCMEGVTVNSSPNSVRAYERLGFARTDSIQVKDGIVFIPMTLEVSQHAP